MIEELIDILVEHANEPGCCVASKREDGWIFVDGDFDAAKAIRAILARMREPTEAAVMAGAVASFEFGDRRAEDRARSTFAAMIDAIAEQGR